MIAIYYLNGIETKPSLWFHYAVQITLVFVICYTRCIRLLYDLPDSWDYFIIRISITISMDARTPQSVWESNELTMAMVVVSATRQIIAFQLTHLPDRIRYTLFQSTTPFQSVRTNECFCELDLARANVIHRHNTNVIINFKCFDCFVAVAIICRLLHIHSVETHFFRLRHAAWIFFTICRSKHNFPAPP